MSLDDVRRKDPIISTISVEALQANSEECKTKYGKHHTTYVSIPQIIEKWEKIAERMKANKAVLGTIVAPYGYGKTGTAIDLWAFCEKSGIIAIPPFICRSLNDIMNATHAWLVFKLKSCHPELIDEIQNHYKSLNIRMTDEEAHEFAHKHGISVERSLSILTDLKNSGKLNQDILPSILLEYLGKATDIVIRAGFKGLLVIADEFKLFIQSSSDRDANISRFQQFIWGIIDENKPIGVILSMPDTTYYELKLKSEDILQRLGIYCIM